MVHIFWSGTRIFTDAYQETDIKKLHLGLDHLPYMSSLICHLGCPTPGPVLSPMEMCMRSTICDTSIIPRQYLCICHKHRQNIGPHWIGVQIAEIFKDKTKEVSVEVYFSFCFVISIVRTKVSKVLNNSTFFSWWQAFTAYRSASSGLKKNVFTFDFI